MLLVLAGGWAAVLRRRRGRPGPATLRLRELLGDRLAISSGTFELHHHPQWAVLTLLAALVLVLAGLAVVAAGRHAGGWACRPGTPPAVSAEARRSVAPAGPR